MWNKIKTIKLTHMALALSLAVNMFVIGAGLHLTSKYRDIRGDEQWIEKRLDRAESRILRHFEGDDRALAQRVFRERRSALSEAFDDIRAARRDFRRSMAEETPDPQKLTAALNASEQAAGQVNETFHGALRDMAQGLSPEARRKVAEHMQRHRRYQEQ